MEEKLFNNCFLEITGRIQMIREGIQKGVLRNPEKIQDMYEDILDRVFVLLGATEKQRDFFWSISDPL